MSFYEIVFIVRQDLSASTAHQVAQTLKDFVTSGGGAVLKSEYCGHRTLAYKIDGQMKGHYILLIVSCEHALKEELEHTMNLNQDILRFLIVCLNRLPARGPSALVQRDREGPERTGYVVRSSQGTASQESSPPLSDSARF